MMAMSIEPRFQLSHDFNEVIFAGSPNFCDVLRGCMPTTAFRKPSHFASIWRVRVMSG
jgi:hypothetical protein